MGTILLLGPSDAARVTEHLLRLDEHDRRMRFCTSVNEVAIKRHVAAINWEHDSLYGCVEDEEIRGLAHFSPDRNPKPVSAEAAFSVETTWRRRGVAARLVELTLAVALNRYIPTLYMIMLCENSAMREVARRQGFLFNYEDGDIYAVARLAETEPTPYVERVLRSRELVLPGAPGAWRAAPSAA